TKLCASKFSPRKATNNSPCLSVRESVLILSIKVFLCPDETAAPANSAISRIDNRFIRTPPDDLRSRAARPEYHRTERCDRRTPGTVASPKLFPDVPGLAAIYRG